MDIESRDRTIGIVTLWTFGYCGIWALIVGFYGSLSIVMEFPFRQTPIISFLCIIGWILSLTIHLVWDSPTRSRKPTTATPVSAIRDDFDTKRAQMGRSFLAHSFIIVGWTYLMLSAGLVLFLLSIYAYSFYAHVPQTYFPVFFLSFSFMWLLLSVISIVSYYRNPTEKVFHESLEEMISGRAERRRVAQKQSAKNKEKRRQK